MRTDRLEDASIPFTYLVPFDSMVSPAELEMFMAKLQHAYDEMISADPDLSYLGERPAQLYKREPLPANTSTTFFEAAFETVEHALSPRKMKTFFQKALRDAGVRLLLNTHIDAVRRKRVRKADEGP